MVALDAKRVKNFHIVTFADETSTKDYEPLFIIYVDNVKVYFSKHKEHARAVYEKILAMNGEKL